MNKSWTKILLPALSLLLFFSCSAHSRQNTNAYRAGISTVPQWKHEWSRGAVFYELFVRSFQDSNGDGIGDLNGLISRLDYLNDGKPNSGKDLEVDALWLMPIFKSPSYHGYDTADYRHINPDYGTDADFERLLQEAHKRGIHILVDLVINHSSSEHPWFLDSSSSASSAKRSWYVWRPDDPGWKQPWGGNNPTWHFKNSLYYYGVFWSGMPDLNFSNSSVRKEFKDLASYWLSRGLDGFRLDATRYLIETGPVTGQADTPETHEWLKEFSAHVRSNHPQTTLVGENWTETPIIAKYYGSTKSVLWGDELPMNFDFPLSDQIVEGVKTGKAENITAKIVEVQSLYPPEVNDAPFLTNHDQIRLATQLQNKESHLRSAVSILLTLQGSPFLYYGEEVGIQNGPAQGDEAKRTPMPWENSPGGGFTTAQSPWHPFAPGRESANVASQIGNPSSLLSHYRNLIRLRKTSQALSHGSIEMLTPASSSSPVLAYLRRSADQLVLVAHNLNDSFVSSGPYRINAISAQRLFVAGVLTDPSGTSGQWNLSMPPHSTGIWVMK